MGVRKGYKQTEVGVIPEDWDLRPLGEVVTFLDGKRRPVKDADRAKMRGSIPYYGASGIVDYVNDYLFNEDLILLGEDGENILSRNCRLAFRISGKAWVNNHAHVLKPKPDISIGFLTDFLESLNYERYNSGTAQPKLNKQTCFGIPVVLPPTKAEQTAIATALSDADALIQSLERLIAKKRNIKQGAMQELLKPKEGWEREPLREVSFMKGRIGWQGLKQTEFTMNADDPFLITGMNFKDGAIRWDEVYHVSFERYQIAKEIQLKQNDVLMTKDGTIGKLLFVDKIPYPGKATLNSHLIVFRPIQNSYDPKFLYYQLSSKSFNEHIELSKSGTTFFGLSQEAVGNYPAFLPQLNEQTRIATILSDMDAEIEALRIKLAKYKQIKQGMMQELLTGRIRLV
ncbi:MAG: restriction endonuclease subunit S [Nitrospirae bacterium]|nr:restriction endonuclease subunit S [Nitrospirota bacterium]